MVPAPPFLLGGRGVYFRFAVREMCMLRHVIYVFCVLLVASAIGKARRSQW
jgi:hypothetical protein